MVKPKPSTKNKVQEVSPEPQPALKRKKSCSTHVDNEGYITPKKTAVVTTQAAQDSAPVTNNYYEPIAGPSRDGVAPALHLMSPLLPPLEHPL